MRVANPEEGLLTVWPFAHLMAHEVTAVVDRLDVVLVLAFVEVPRRGRSDRHDRAWRKVRIAGPGVRHLVTGVPPPLDNPRRFRAVVVHLGGFGHINRVASNQRPVSVNE